MTKTRIPRAPVTTPSPARRSAGARTGQSDPSVADLQTAANSSTGVTQLARLQALSDPPTTPVQRLAAHVYTIKDSAKRHYNQTGHWYGIQSDSDLKERLDTDDPGQPGSRTLYLGAFGRRNVPCNIAFKNNRVRERVFRTVWHCGPTGRR